MSSSDCPKCQGPRDAKALYCPFCGIIFARYAAAPPPAEAPAQPLFAAAMAPVLAPAAAGFAPPAAMGGAAETLYEGPPPAAAWNPYQGPGEPAVPSFSAIPNLELASRGSRLIAQFLNLLVVVAIIFAGVFLSAFLASATNNENVFMAAMILGAGLPLALVLIFNLRQLAATGQSLGKKWMGIRIVRSSGEKAPLSHLLLLRYLSMQLIGLVPILGPIAGVVNVLMIFGEEQRCLHDRFADTLVVRA